ncbi:hypothetical protein GEMRC1_007566 [Eukaryota sp. GEM-RC1]
MIENQSYQGLGFQGIVQSVEVNNQLQSKGTEEGGPCGVIASFQATVLSYLISNPSVFKNSGDPNNVFAKCFADVVWKTSTSSSATLVIVNPDQSDGQLERDLLSVLRKVRIIRCRTPTELFENVLKFWPILSYFGGYFSLVLSLVLTKSPENLVSEGGIGRTSLITKYGYTSQELVNLILIGVGSGQVFDGIRDLEGHVMIGVEKRSTVGFLTVFEWFNYLEVGDNFKNPLVDVWVIMAENHYSVFFNFSSVSYYWDPLGRMDNLAVCILDRSHDDVTVVPDEVPPMELAIRTRWRKYLVKWEGLD